MKTPLTRHILVWGITTIILMFFVANESFSARVTGEDEPVTTSESQQENITKNNAPARSERKGRASRRPRNTAEAPATARQNVTAETSGQTAGKVNGEKSATL